MRSTFALLTLLLIAALGLVSPSGCPACQVDLHGGQGLHVVFDHPHPAAPLETDGLAASASGQPAIHASHAVSGGKSPLAGQVLPRPDPIAEFERAVDRLATLHSGQPVSLDSRPLDPPPRTVL